MKKATDEHQKTVILIIITISAIVPLIAVLKFNDACLKGLDEEYSALLGAPVRFGPGAICFLVRPPALTAARRNALPLAPEPALVRTASRPSRPFSATIRGRLRPAELYSPRGALAGVGGAAHPDRLLARHHPLRRPLFLGHGGAAGAGHRLRRRDHLVHRMSHLCRPPRSGQAATQWAGRHASCTATWADTFCMRRRCWARSQSSKHLATPFAPRTASAPREERGRPFRLWNGRGVAERGSEGELFARLGEEWRVVRT